MMKKSIIPAILIPAMIFAASCAKTSTETDNESNKRYIEAWMEVNHAEVFAEGAKCGGIWVISDEPGTGEAIGTESMAFIKYRIRDLKGNISETLFEEDNRRLGKWSSTTYYGAKPYLLGGENLSEGMEEAIKGGEDLEPMKVGGKRTVVVPNWLNTTTRYDDPKKYFENITGTPNAIFEIELCDFTNDIVKYEVDTIENFLKGDVIRKIAYEIDNDGGWGQIDTVGNGFGLYWRSLREPESGDGIEDGTKLYVNYTGRLLNGKVFDTTIRDTAIFYDIVNSSKTYEPVLINWNNDFKELTMTAEKTKVASGFSKLITKMHPMEKVIGVFTSDLGYGTTGSSPGIPAYAPLVFEVEMTSIDETDNE